MEDKQIVLEIDGVEIECSQSKLAECSDYFKVMFHGSFIENSQNVIHLKDISPSDMQLALKMIDEKDTVKDLSVNQALGVLQVVSMFQFHNLQTLVEKHLCENLTEDNCLFVAQSAEGLLICNLAFKASLYSYWEFSHIQQTEAFLELSIEELKKYLSSDLLYTPDGELKVFEGAWRWLIHNNFPDMFEILKCVRFHLLTIDDLNSILTSSVASDCPLIKEVLAAVFDSKVSSREELHKTKEVKEENAPNNSTKLSRYQRDVQVAAPGIIQFLKQVNSNPRRSPFVPCFTAYFSLKEAKTYPRRPKMVAFCFDELRKNKLYPFMSMEHDAVGCAFVSKGGVILSVGGEHNLGQGKWNNALRGYNVWQKKWDVVTELPRPRRHHSVIIVGDDVYLLCGFGKFRVLLDSFEKYNMRRKEWTKLAPLPETAYSVAACAHKGSIYVIHNQSLCYQYSIATNAWTKLPAHFPPAAGFNNALSYGDHIYLTGLHSNDMYKFEPGSDATLVGEFNYGASSICLVGCYIYSFTATDGKIFVERYDISTNEFSVVWSSKTETCKSEFMTPLRAFPVVNCVEEIHNIV